MPVFSTIFPGNFAFQNRVVKLRALLSSRFFRNAGTMSVGSAVVQIIAFASSLVLTRLYAPQHFGVLAVFLAFLTFAGAISSLHYEMAIALPKEPERGAAVTLLALCLALCIAILSVLAFAPFAGNLAGRLGYAELDAVWWLLPLAILGAGFQQALTLWNARCHRFSTVAQNGILQSLTQSGLQILFGFAKLGSLGLILGLTFSRFVAGGSLLIRRFREDHELYSKACRHLRTVAFEFRSFPLVGLWGAVLHVTCFQVAPLLLAELYDSSVAGFYLLQDRVLSVPLTVLGQGVASVFYVNAARLARDDPQALRISYFRILRNLALTGLLPTLALVISGPAWVYARIFAVSMLFRFVAGPLFRCLTILNKQWWILIFDGLGLLFIVSATTYLSVMGFSSLWAVAAISAGLAAVAAISAGLALSYGGLLIASTLAVVVHSRLSRPELHAIESESV
jgi:lipopolysaccharide exporter